MLSHEINLTKDEGQFFERCFHLGWVNKISHKISPYLVLSHNENQAWRKMLQNFMKYFSGTGVNQIVNTVSV